MSAGFTRTLLILACVITIASCSRSGTVTEQAIEPAIAKQQTYSYTRDIKPILDQKCIACHACYDAPCQLKLSSPEGLLRGATKQAVYDGGRLDDAQPTRLFVDAHGQAQWRAKGFFSALNDRGGSLQNNLDNSTLFKMIELGRNNPLAANSPVPAHINFGLARETSCPSPQEFADYAKENPQQGMPLAITGLSDGEYQTLREWIFEGALTDDPTPPVAAQEQLQIDRWETFFNRQPLRNQLVARYLYEHLQPAHLYFDELDTGNYFEWVRSSTPPGKPVEIIASLRPNDDPGKPFYYRLSQVRSTLVHKAHLAYALGQARMDRFQALFLDSDWSVSELPDYSPAIATNPVAAFQAIPAGARYQFMLDNAHYFVASFIRGPVCAGQIATNVIEDQFFVLFQDPKSDLSVTNAEYLAAIEPHLALVPQQEGLVAMMRDWKARLKEMDKYNLLRGLYYLAAEPQGRSLDDIWYGDGSNDNAALTVFRNFDNAMVAKGFVGADPKTVWVMDYPMFERTFYLLVVNFNVFGSVATQAETRLYFDLMRANGENNFLHFMPPDVRTPMRDSWYRGELAEWKMSSHYQIVNEDAPVNIAYSGDDPKAEFIRMTSQRLPGHAGLPDAINRCAKAPCYSQDASADRRRVETSLQTIASLPATSEGMGFIAYLPDVAFLRISDTASSAALAYTLIRNKAHSNVAFMFAEADRREPGQDTLSIYPGLLGSYPNFMFNVPLDSIEEFTADLRAAQTADAFGDLVGRYGLMRTNPKIWENFQWFVDYVHEYHPRDAGIYDLNRYKKVAELVEPGAGG